MFLKSVVHVFFTHTHIYLCNWHNLVSSALCDNLALVLRGHEPNEVGYSDRAVMEKNMLGVFYLLKLLC